MRSLGESFQQKRYEPRDVKARLRSTMLLRWLCTATAMFSIVVLAILLFTIFQQGASRLSWSFLTSSPHPDPTKTGIWPALMGTFWTCMACGLLTLPIGVGTAIFLEELRPRNTLLRWLHALVQLNISNLAGVPSVVYGIVGMTAFVSMFGLFASSTQSNGEGPRPVVEFGVQYFDQFLTLDDQVLLVPVDSSATTETQPRDGLMCVDSKGNRVQMRVLEKGQSQSSVTSPSATVRWDETPGRVSKQAWYHFRLPFGRSVLAGGLTLMLVILPIVILSSQEAFRAVPSSLREAALGVGATPWQVVWRVTLPASIPGIMTGAILAMSRAIGEAAPIMMVSGIVFITRAPSNLMSVFTVLSLQIYDWAGRHEADFHRASAAAIIILLVVLLMFNSLAILIRYRYSKPLS